MVAAFKLCFWILIIGIMIGLIAMVIWFVLALVISFWKVYCQPPLKKSITGIIENNCNHSSYHYAENHPDQVWKCNDCGENFK